MVTDQIQTGYQWLIFIEVQRNILLSLFSFLHSKCASLQKSAVSLWMSSEVLYLCQDLGILSFDMEQSEVCRRNHIDNSVELLRNRKPLSRNANGITRDKLITLPTLGKYFWPSWQKPSFTLHFFLTNCFFFSFAKAQTVFFCKSPFIFNIIFSVQNK